MVYILQLSGGCEWFPDSSTLKLLNFLETVVITDRLTEREESGMSQVKLPQLFIPFLQNSPPPLRHFLLGLTRVLCLL